MPLRQRFSAMSFKAGAPDPTNSGAVGRLPIGASQDCGNLLDSRRQPPRKTPALHGLLPPGYFSGVHHSLFWNLLHRFIPRPRGSFAFPRFSQNSPTR